MRSRLFLFLALAWLWPTAARAQPVITPGAGYPDSWQVNVFPVPGDPCTGASAAIPGCIMSVGDIMHVYLGEGLGTYNNPSASTSSAQCGFNGPIPTAVAPRNPDVLLWPDPVQPTKYCWASAPANFLMSSLPDGQTYVFTMATVIGSLTSAQSPPSIPFTYQAPVVPAAAGQLVRALAAPGDPTLCTPPLGPESISIFVTDWSATTGRPGSRAHVDFQAASKSAITRISARLNGLDVATGAGADVGALWFTTPAVAGSYGLTVYVENAYGCTRETLSPRTVTVR